MPRSRPRVVFNDEGICNACINAQNKKLINWDERRIEFEEVVKNIKTNKKSIYVNSDYDCVVPWSGGKDSSYIAHRLKFEFKLSIITHP
jgi:tRNA(Ile)-lysidine synthase TilS/MesJ